MPFDRNEKMLRELVDRAITQDQQIRSGLAEVGYEEDEIQSEVVAGAESVWEVAVDEIRRYNSAEQHLQQLRDSVAKEAGPPPTSDQSKEGALGAWLSGIGALYGITLVGWAVFQLISDWRAALAAWWVFAALLTIPLAAIFGVVVWLEKRTDNAKEVLKANFEKKVVSWRQKLAEIEKRQGIDSLAPGLPNQEATIEHLLLERVRQTIVGAINKRLTPSFAVTLDIRRPRGFGEVFDKRFTIQTPARRRLQFMLENMPGGSIGIAGSRGAGKSTLLRLFCGPKRVIETLNQKPVLGVLVSAPVAYQARDFILYLFSAICQNVIESEGGTHAFPTMPSDTSSSSSVDGFFFERLRRTPFLLIRTGLWLWLAGLSAALVLSTLESSAPLPTSFASAADAAGSKSTDSPRAVPPGGSMPVVPSAGGNTPASTVSGTAIASSVPATRSAIVTARPVQSASVPIVTKADDSFVLRWARYLKIDPSVWMGWATLLIASGALLGEFLLFGAWRTFRISVVQILARTIGIIPLFGEVAESALDKLFLPIHERENRLRTGRDGDIRTADSVLGNAAETWLKAIKFQQSYTSGWSGALKLPIGLEGGVNRAVTLAQNQLSLPEIVHFLTRFLEQISLKYQVIIGIDEMDKLATDDLAQQFLNDIKSIFGLERCFYLIAVSEDAMSNFERRGLKFRDVFDSAFDDFVFVDHLNFESAKGLLEQRVVGRPVPFFALSYCMSAGLARDLIRNFRSVIEIHEQSPESNDLDAICGTLVKTDLLAKVRATRSSVRKIDLDPEVGLFLESLYRVEEVVESDVLLADATKRLLGGGVSRIDAPSVKATAGDGQTTSPSAAAVGQALGSAEDKERGQKIAEIRTLADELGTYICYSVTLRQFFNNRLTESMLTQPPPSGSLDALSRARRVLGTNPTITRMLLKSFRAGHGLGSFPEEDAGDVRGVVGT